MQRDQLTATGIRNQTFQGTSVATLSQSVSQLGIELVLSLTLVLLSMSPKECRNTAAAFLQ